MRQVVVVKTSNKKRTAIILAKSNTERFISYFTDLHYIEPQAEWRFFQFKEDSKKQNWDFYTISLNYKLYNLHFMQLKDKKT